MIYGIICYLIGGALIAGFLSWIDKTTYNVVDTLTIIIFWGAVGICSPFIALYYIAVIFAKLLTFLEMKGGKK